MKRGLDSASGIVEYVMTYDGGVVVVVVVVFVVRRSSSHVLLLVWFGVVLTYRGRTVGCGLAHIVACVQPDCIWCSGSARIPPPPPDYHSSTPRATPTLPDPDYPSNPYEMARPDNAGAFST